MQEILLDSFLQLSTMRTSEAVKNSFSKPVDFRAFPKMKNG